MLFRSTFSDSYEQSEVSHSFNPGETGVYTVEVIPDKFGDDIPILGPWIEGEALAETSFTVSEEESTAWETYCARNYNVNSIQGKINCLKNDVVPTYFEGEVPQNAQVAQSACQDLLGYNFNRGKKICEP